VLLLLQLVRPSIPTSPATAEVQVPTAVGHVLEKDCYSCHSDQRRLAWFDQIVPGYWLVRYDILTAREHLNFSTLGAKPAPAQKGALYESVNFMQLGAMPLARYLALHPGATVTPGDLETLKAYLAPWASPPHQPSDTSGGGTAGAPIALASVRAELDGFPFDPDFESWKPISITDRGDNNTFRFVLGNDIAVRAARAGKTAPWPDGTRFAKIAWWQDLGADGLVHPGRFVQVELMLKGGAQYKATEGWGWGRWRGMDLTPYGKDAHFVNECTGCHLPVRPTDYVYTPPMLDSAVSRAGVLPAGLPYQPLDWNAITLYVDPKSRTMALLSGNDIAIQAVRARAGVAPEVPAYQPGAVLALVTWAQRDDPHWFGARIPDTPQSVEFVQVAAGQASNYRRFAGAGLAEDHPAAGVVTQRTNDILHLTPAALP
jgi:hypothetical protein